MAKDNTLKKFATRIKKQGAAFVKDTTDFNDIVKDAVRYAWQGYDINQTVNATLDLALVMKGLNRRALATYFVKCVPYGFNKKENRFDKKDAKKAAKLETTWEDYVNTHDWFEEAKSTNDAKPYELNVATLVSMIDSRVNKADDSGTLHGQGAVGTMQDLKSKLDSTINEFIKTFEAQAHSDLIIAQNADSVEDSPEEKSEKFNEALDEAEEKLLAELEADPELQAANG